MTHRLQTGGDRGYLRIATEEAFATQPLIDCYLRMIRDGSADKGMVSLWGYYAGSPDAPAAKMRERLLDMGSLRLAEMDQTGIDKAVLGLTSPGVQPLHDVGEARALARQANDFLAERCAAHPDRFIGLAAVAPQDPTWSAAEIRRGADQLGFKGVQIHSHTQGRYLDDEAFDPIFRALADTGQPLYLHPSTPPDTMIGPMLEAGLDGAIFGFGVETGMHLLRLILTGVFDRYPDLQIMVGHMGEGLPYWLYRLEFMHRASLKTLRYERIRPIGKSIGDYLRSNVLMTCSGMAWEPAIAFCQSIIGEDRVMYAMDYPYQYVADEVRTLDLMDMPDATKRKFFQTNAERWFGL